MRAALQRAAALGLLAAAWFSRQSDVPPNPVVAWLVRSIIKHPFLTLIVVGVGGAAVGLMVIASGAVPIKASSGHWWITARVLDFAKVRSVTTHSLRIEAPPLDDPALVLRGAAHYESGCYVCHGGPGGEIPPVMAAMTPMPPVLSTRIDRWDPQELFSIVKHGIKFTGMPAWPAQERDDEVWAVVAFLREFPRLDSVGYRRLVYGDSGAVPEPPSIAPTGGLAAPPAVRNNCWRCHGVDGTGRGDGSFPSLAGQRAAYLYGSLRGFADRKRFSGIMSTIAASLTDEAMHDSAHYYAALPPRPADVASDPAAILRGQSIVSRGNPNKDVPSCADCHGPSDTPKNAAYPRLAGQHVRYLTLQLQLLQQRRRGGSEYVNLMHVFVNRLGPEQIRDVTTYYATLDPQPRHGR